jgi:hypothetical protein
MTKEIIKQALDVLKSKDTWGSSIRQAKEDAIKALEEALKQEQTEPATKEQIREAIVHNLPLYTTPQQRKPLTNDEFLELLLRKGSRDIVAYTTFVGGSIQMQGKIGLLKSAKVIKEFIEECYGIKELKND